MTKATEMESIYDLTKDEESTDNTLTQDLNWRGESKLHKYFSNCKKNPEHKEFIPIYDFNILNLPREYQDHEIVNFIKTIADLTVRVFVTMTSTERPEFWPNTKQPYPFYDKIGCDVMRVGSGIVCKVTEVTDLNNEGCHCNTCKHSDTPSKVCGEIFVVTATHVVFDQTEAQKTKCRFFFDHQDGPIFTCDPYTMVQADVESDRCIIKATTCDVNLFNKLQIALRQSDVIRSRMIERYWSSNGQYNLCIITSHPHGCPKYVCVGRWIDRCEIGFDKTRYTYTTCTCPGSAGAPVFILSRLDYKGYHTHSGVNSEGFNFSGTFNG